MTVKMSRNLNEAQKLLSDMQRRFPNRSPSTSGEIVGGVLSTSSAGYQSVPMTKIHPTSVGTISGATGRDYGSQLTSICKGKPKVLNVADVTFSDFEDRKDYNEVGKSIPQVIEGFIYDILGDGFSLDESIIQDILGQCGYDVKQSMERPMHLSSPPTLEKTVDRVKSHPEEELCGESFSSLPTTHRKSRCVPRANEKSDLAKELLGALFTAPVRTTNEPVKISPQRVRPVVQHPLCESLIEYQPIISTTIVKDDENEDNYDMLRKAAAEYRATMKEYNTAAAVALGKQDYDKAQKLYGEADFYLKKSKEADDKSARKLVKRDNVEDLNFDVSKIKPAAALRLLKSQIPKLAGSSSYRFLKLIVGCGDGNSQHASRKRMMLRLLENECIKWTEEGEGWTVVILLSEVKPENLSLSSK